MTNGDEPPNNVRPLRPRPTANDGSTPTLPFSISASLIAGEPGAAAVPLDAEGAVAEQTESIDGREQVEQNSVPDAREFDQTSPEADDFDDDWELPYADGSTEPLTRRRRGLLRPKPEPASFSLEQPVPAIAAPNFDQPQSQAARPAVGAEPVSASGDGNDWSATPLPVSREPAGSGRRPRRRYLALAGLLVLALIAAVAITGALTSGRGAGAPAAAKTHHQTHSTKASVPGRSRHATRAVTTTKRTSTTPAHKHKPRKHIVTNVVRTDTTSTTTTTSAVSTSAVSTPPTPSSNETATSTSRQTPTTSRTQTGSSQLSPGGDLPTPAQANAAP